MIISTGDRLAFDLPATEGAKSKPTEPAAAPERVLTDAEIRSLEADNLRAALRAAGGKIYGPGGAAERLGVRPTTLASRMKALGLGRSFESGRE